MSPRAKKALDKHIASGDVTMRVGPFGNPEYYAQTRKAFDEIAGPRVKPTSRAFALTGGVIVYAPGQGDPGTRAHERIHYAQEKAGYPYMSKEWLKQMPWVREAGYDMKAPWLEVPAYYFGSIGTDLANEGLKDFPRITQDMGKYMQFLKWRDPQKGSSLFERAVPEGLLEEFIKTKPVPVGRPDPKMKKQERGLLDDIIWGFLK